MTSVFSSLLTFCLSALGLALLGLCTPASAQTAPTLAAPNAGQVLRDLRQTPHVVVPVAPLQRIEETADLNQRGQARVLVKTIRIAGNTEVPTSALQPLVADLIGTEQSLTQLNAATQRITAYYRSQGLAAARAYLPEQNITNGAVTIAVIDGRIASYKINNESRLSTERADGFLAVIKDGDVVKSEKIDRPLLLLQDTPGVALSRATLQPGASPGASELLIDVKPADSVSGHATFDNYGGRYTGEYRFGAGLNIANPLNIGDIISFNGLTSGQGLSFGSLSYQLPIGSDGLKLGVAYLDVRHKLGREFAALLARGTAKSTTVFASYPFIRSRFSNLHGTLSYEDKTTTDFIGAAATETLKKIKVTSLGLSGNMQDNLAGGGFNAFDVASLQGRLGIQSPGALAIDAASARTEGSFTKVTWGASRLQHITHDTQISVSITGQQAGKNLDIVEKFSLGGPTSIRAYPTGEALGDEGYRGTLELRQSLMQNIQGVVFYDFGSIKINKNPFGAAGASNNKTLAGAGLGINASISKVHLRASVAWRLSPDLPLSIPANAVKSATFWLQASIGF